MSYHIVSIDSPQCSISCKDGQLRCRVPGEEQVKTLPLEDIACIIITSFSVNIHSHLLLEAAKHKVALVICESFKPVSVVLPANRSTDTILTRAVLNLGERTRTQLWQKTVDAKCQNQCALAAHISPEDPSLNVLHEIALGRKPHKEAICAKLFWNVFGRALGQDNFIRERSGGGLNSLLNYGYAVLLSTVLQKLFGVGLDPTFGIAHVERERSTPLAYDLMEPFRPIVDWRVFQWVGKLQRDSGALERNAAESGGSIFEVTKEYRQWVTGFPLTPAEHRGCALNAQGCVEAVVRSFRHAVLENSGRAYQPWIASGTTWLSSHG